MADLVVTLPLSYGLEQWIAEGDVAGAPDERWAGELWSGKLWYFGVGGERPDIRPGERVYVVYSRKLRGYAPLIKVQRSSPNYWWASAWWGRGSCHD